MATMIVTTHFGVLAAAADANQFAFDGSARQVWVDIFVSAVQGIATLPIALVVVWLFHRANLDRWTLLSAVLATAFAIAIAGLLEAMGLPIWAAVSAGLSAMGLQQFVYELWPAVSVIFVGSILFAFWLKRRRKLDFTASTDVFE